MMRRASPKRTGSAGFTLLEMLVTLSIIGLLTSLSVQLLRPPSANLRVETAARALCSTLRATRSRALATNSELAVTIDLGRRSFSSPVAVTAMLPDEALIEVEAASSQRESAELANILFYPDGSSTGGEIVIRSAGRRATIDVNWLTGEAKCDVV